MSMLGRIYKSNFVIRDFGERFSMTSLLKVRGKSARKYRSSNSVDKEWSFSKELFAVLLPEEHKTLTANILVDPAVDMKAAERSGEDFRDMEA